MTDKTIENLHRLFSKNSVESPLLDSFDAGNLLLTSGKLVASDPILTPDKEAFVQELAVGEYPTVVHIESASKKIAYVEIIFNKKNVSHWELARTKGQELSDLQKGEIFGFPVQSGMACFMDFTTQTLLSNWETDRYEEKGEAFEGIYQEFFHDAFFPNKKTENQFVSLSVSAKEKGNLIAYEAGHGEGFYGCYFGYDKEGEPAKFVAEFIEIGAK